MTQDRHGEINDNATLMLANAQHPLKRMDRSNVSPRVNGAAAVPTRVGVFMLGFGQMHSVQGLHINMVFRSGIYHMKEDEL